MEPKAIIHTADGTERDITELVKILYDGVISSLDWGSGFWDGEDAAAVSWIGLAFGWVHASDAEAFAREIQKYEKFRGELDAALPPLTGKDG